MIKKYFTVTALDICLDVSQLAIYFYALTSHTQWVSNVLPFVAGMNLLLASLLMVLYLMVVGCLTLVPDFDKSIIEGDKKSKNWRYLVSGLNLVAAYSFAAQSNYSTAAMIAATEIIVFVALAVKSGILQSETVK